jgi:uncharacterized membrane protein YcaP (DUF421 family)
MESILRPIVIYVFLLVIFRLAGRRSLSEITTFDFVLLLIIGESTQQALLGDDFSMTNAVLVIVTLIGLDIGFGLIKGRLPLLKKIAEGTPMVLIENGQPLERRMRRARIELDDIMRAARESQGLERVEDIKFAILEVSGGISIIPRKEE